MRAGLLLAHGLTLAVTVLCSASLALAKAPRTILVAGQITYKVTADDPVALGDTGLVLIRQKLEGTIKSSIANSPIDNSKQTCVGSITFRSNTGGRRRRPLRDGRRRWRRLVAALVG